MPTREYLIKAIALVKQHIGNYYKKQWIGGDTNRNIRYIIIHHTAGEKNLSNIDRSHKRDFTLGFDQPVSERTDYKNIAYHFAIIDGERTQTRDLNVVGYHAGNLDVNLKAVGVVVGGDYTVVNPRKRDVAETKKLVSELRFAFPNAEVLSHRNVRKTGYTECCGTQLMLALFSVFSQNPREQLDRDEW